MVVVNNNIKKVLFLARQYAPVPKVCEICVKRVRESLYTKGIMSDVLQFTGDGEGREDVSSCAPSAYYDSEFSIFHLSASYLLSL